MRYKYAIYITFAFYTERRQEMQLSGTAYILTFRVENF